MAIVFWMSTETFSSNNTIAVVGEILHFLAPSLSLHQVEIGNAVIRKSGHVAEYFILGILLFRAFRSGTTQKRVWHWAIFSALAVALYAASDEFHQSLVASRTASFLDVCIDAAAGILAQGVSVLWYRRRSSSGKAAV